jgi:hypothetical protein
MGFVRHVVRNLHIFLLGVETHVVKADGKQDFLLHHLLARVCWQLKVKEARVGFRQSLIFDVLWYILVFLLLIVSGDRPQQES